MKRHTTARILTSFTAAGLTLALIGCEEGSGTPSVSTTTAEATVHGTVKVKGVLAKKGEVAFDPKNIKRKDAPVARAQIGADGTYTLKTLAGENGVTVNTPETKKSPKLGFFSKQVDLKAGENTVDLDVTPSP